MSGLLSRTSPINLIRPTGAKQEQASSQPKSLGCLLGTLISHAAWSNSAYSPSDALAPTRTQAKTVSAGEVLALYEAEARRCAVTGGIGDAGGYDLIKILSDDQIRSTYWMPSRPHTLGGCAKRGAAVMIPDIPTLNGILSVHVNACMPRFRNPIALREAFSQETLPL
ncbi:hypothetical protein GGI43DRAFT_254906 [Trichoderma evansii]